MAESKEELKSLLMIVKEESENVAPLVAAARPVSSPLLFFSRQARSPHTISPKSSVPGDQRLAPERLV